MAHTVMY